jgi:ribosomal protein S18 acetylase RimI-like enzyme
MEFRILSIDDVSAWSSLRLEALETEPLAFGMSPEEHKAKRTEEVAAMICAKPNGSFTLGGFDSGKLVAIATFVRETGIKQQHKGHIYGVYVAASHRGLGLGKQLLSEVLDRVKQEPSIEQVLLAVSAHNAAALRTYRRLGFAVYGTEPRALKVGSEIVNEHQMILILRS